LVTLVVSIVVAEPAASPPPGDPTQDVGTSGE
jgi:hypothetical protein